MISVTGKLNKSANKRQSQNGTVFLVNVGVQVYNRTSKEKEWVNYSAALFAKDSQAEFYDKALNQGAIVEIMGSGVLPRLWGDNNDKVSLDIQDARLGYVDYANSQPAPSQQPQQQHLQQGYQNQPNPTYTQAAPAPQPAPGGFDDFDDNIPF